MSNALAIATVTAALAQIVREAVQSESIQLSGADVSIGQPDGTPLDGPRVRLFLYQISPNAALRNNDLPTRSANGNLTKRPTVALDLHYLLAFYGDERALEPQRMLGAAVRDIHAQPVLTQQMIEDVITSASYPYLAQSNLTDAVEQVKFTPLPLSLEELSKIWSVFFQTTYALTIAYQASVVLIESEENVHTVLPVLRRGAEDQGVDIRLGPFPILDSIHIGIPEDAERRPRMPSYPAAQLGAMLIITGQNLAGEIVSIRFEHARLGITKIVEVPPGDRSHNELKIALADDAAAHIEWAAGLYTVTVTVQTGDTRRTTNQIPLSFAPRVTRIEPASPVVRDIDGNVTLSITCSPQVHLSQHAALLIADREVAAQPHLVETDPLQFIITDAPTVNNALVRLRIDGVDSLPFRRQAVPPPPRLVFDDSQRITIHE